MNPKVTFFLAAASLALSSAAFAAGAKTHEVTGTVLETTPTKIVLQKGAERWEIDLDPQTKVSGELKVGAKVTITYAMSATKIDAGPLTKLKAAAEEAVAPITSSVAPGSQKKEVPAVSPTP
jgi:type 1 fimbria pilin